MTRLALGVVLAALVAYGAWEAYPLLAGPAFSISSPTEGGHYAGGVVLIEGRASRAASFTLNGAPLLTDASGRFKTTLAFPTGESILTFMATDRFGRRLSKERLIYVP